MATIESRFGKSVRRKRADFSFMTVAGYFEEQIGQCRLRGALGTARNYERTRNSFMSFLGSGSEMTFAGVDVGLVGGYEAWLRQRGVVRNSSSFYMRNLRALYNKAVKEGLAEQTFPFRYVYTGVDRTRKRAVAERMIQELQGLYLGGSKPLELARDLFLFSYCTRGMAFVDVVFLRKDDVRGGVISYVRRKTGQRLSVGLEPCMARIIARYTAVTAGSPYVFPVLRSTDPAKAYRQYTIALNYHNRNLKTIGSMLGLEVPLSSYIARHTWATAAHSHGVPISIISAGMGHTSERTTQIYLDSMDTSIIDEANRGLLEGLNG